ncbi:hypothetical protein AWJ20_3163 [Sugiyamaella lignohabitans]|uniref:Uncharacterized protein n=1 Tax=Sugiyamaella lignohabitans TaxID=796027 RepID=A0A167FPA4_9ASCO|nr:uncharacterized protein AWJ20_3163 [Sugiyamaella lignohabitans]ANB15535.1 hypothetical protein AWJ20_3163 [Sugiyamaella lignohabitans]
MAGSGGDSSKVRSREPTALGLAIGFGSSSRNPSGASTAGSTPLDIPQAGSYGNELTYFPVEQFAESPHDPNTLSTFYNRVKSLTTAATSVMQNVLPGSGQKEELNFKRTASGSINNVSNGPDGSPYGGQSSGSGFSALHHLAPSAPLVTSGLSPATGSASPAMNINSTSIAIPTVTRTDTFGSTVLAGLPGVGSGIVSDNSTIGSSMRTNNISDAAFESDRAIALGTNINTTTSDGNAVGASTPTASPLRYLQNPWNTNPRISGSDGGSDMLSTAILTSQKAAPSVANVTVGEYSEELNVDRSIHSMERSFSKHSTQLSRSPSTSTMYSYNPRSHLPGYALEQDDASDTESIVSSNRDYIISQLSRRIEPITPGGLNREFWMKDENASECFRCARQFTGKSYVSYNEFPGHTN